MNDATRTRNRANTGNTGTTGKRWSRARLLLGAALLLLSILFIYNARGFFSFDPKLLGKYFPFKWVIMGHIAGGAIALLTGPFQLWKAFRNRYRRIHRVMGRVYVGAIGVGAVCALTLASTTALSIGWPYVLSLYALASVWLTSTVLAWRAAVNKRFKSHEEWATRSYLATVAFVLQATSMEIPFIARLGGFAEISPTIIWLSWTIPMFAYDCVLTLKQNKPQDELALRAPRPL